MILKKKKKGKTLKELTQKKKNLSPKEKILLKEQKIKKRQNNHLIPQTLKGKMTKKTERKIPKKPK